jgi:prepilin-type N-terminal cleavage/methylation domain-containing protein
MTTCERGTARPRTGADGFTLLEVVVVLAVLGLLLGTAMPLVGAVVQADRRQEGAAELADIAAALQSYWYEHAAFPASLVATDFLGVHLQPGVGGTATVDPFGAGRDYVYATGSGGMVATVHSRGENGVDNGIALEDLATTVHGAVVGTRRTHERFRVIVEVLANHIENGGSVAGDWPTVRAACGLGASYERDGFGTALQWTAATHTLTSAGPDRTLGTGDDITL